MRRLALLLSLTFTSVAAQPGTAEGPRRVDATAHRTTTALALDAEGFLWVGTPLGLVRYDGHRTRPVGPDPEGSEPLAFPYVNVGALAVAPDGTVWAGTKGGLLRVDPATGTARWIAPTPDGSPDVRAVAVASDGTVWAGTESGVGVVDATGRRVLRSAATPPVRALHLDGATALVGTTEGLLGGPDPSRLRPVSGPLADAYVTAFEPTPGGLWVATFGSGVYRMSTAEAESWTSARRLPATRPDLRAIALDYDPTDGRVWVGTWRQGLYTADETAPRLTPARSAEAPDAPTVAATLRAGRGGRWFGTWDGLYRAPPPRPYRWLGVDDGLPDEAVGALSAAPPRGLWVGAGPAVVYCDLPDGPCRTVAPNLGADVLDLVPSADGRSAWAAAFGTGVWHVEAPGGAPPESHSDEFFAYTLARAGDSLWVGTLDRGVLAARIADGRLEPLLERVAQTGPAHALSADSRGLRAVASQERGGCLVRGHRLACPPGRPPFAFDVLEGPSGLWVASIEGVSRADPASGLDWVLSESDVPRPDTSCLVEGPDGLWAATGSGLVRLDTETGRVDLQGTAAGLPGLPFDTGACARLGRTLAVGHRDGVLLFDPLRLLTATGPTRVTGAAVDGQHVPTQHGLRLGPRAGGPTFEFATPLTALAPAAYAYRLVGLSETWTTTDDGAASFPPLPPGRYTFEVRTGAGPVARVPLTVLAPFWRRPWALALWALLAAALAVAGHRLRVRSLLRLERTRSQIADDLHDDVGSRLSGLALALDVAGRTLPDGARAEVVDRADQARALLGDLRDAVWAIDGSAGTLADLADRVRAAAESLAGDAQVHLATSGPLDVPLSMTERRHLLSLAKEALHNAARHGNPARLDLALESRPGDGTVRLEVADDGRGFDPSAVTTRGHGLRSLHRRAEALHAALDVRSVPGHGTRVVLRFRPEAWRGWRDRVRPSRPQDRTIPS